MNGEMMLCSKLAVKKTKINDKSVSSQKVGDTRKIRIQNQYKTGVVIQSLNRTICWNSQPKESYD